MGQPPATWILLQESKTNSAIKTSNFSSISANGADIASASYGGPAKPAILRYGKVSLGLQNDMDFGKVHCGLHRGRRPRNFQPSKKWMKWIQKRGLTLRTIFFPRQEISLTGGAKQWYLLVQAGIVVLILTWVAGSLFSP